MGEHAKLSPSAAHRWLKCTASIEATAHIESTTSVYAEEGTLAHDWAAELLEHGDPRKLDEKHASAVDAGYDVKDMKRNVENYRDYVLSVVAEMSKLGDTEMYVEQRVHTDIEALHGTADAIVFNETANKLAVIDLKYGQGVSVAAAGNAQLMIYAVGAMEWLALSGSILDYEKLEVDLCIYQPRLGGLNSHTLTGKELITWFDDVVRPAVEAIENGTGKYAPSDSTCQWCPIAGTCRVARDAVFAQDFDALPAELTAGELAYALEQTKMIKKWIKAVEDSAKAAAFNGDLPGWKMVEGRGRRTVVDPEGLISHATAIGMKADEVSTRTVLGIGALEKAIGKDILEDYFDKYIEKKPGAPSLAPESDSRPAIRSADSDFGNI